MAAAAAADAAGLAEVAAAEDPAIKKNLPDNTKQKGGSSGPPFILLSAIFN
jgi:hypothetical protein